MNEPILTLLDAVYFNGKKLGFITEKGVEWSGNAAEYQKLMAAQQRNAPVLKVKKKDATNELKYRMFQLTPENCQTLMGGTVSGSRWNAPSESVSLEGSMKILTGTGFTIDIPRTSLDGDIRGQLGSSDEPLGIEVTQEILSSGSTPFSIYPTEAMLKVTPNSLSFAKAGETKYVDVEASSGITLSDSPTGFTVSFDGTRIKVVASANGGSTPRTGSITVTLASAPSKTATIQLTQAGS